MNGYSQDSSSLSVRFVHDKKDSYINRSGFFGGGAGDRTQDNDSRLVEECMGRFPDTESVSGFLSGGGIYRLELKFDIDQLRHW